jgi:hypothetical protein
MSFCIRSFTVNCYASFCGPFEMLSATALTPVMRVRHLVNSSVMMIANFFAPGRECMPPKRENALPPDFKDTLASVSELGIMKEPPVTIDLRLSDAVRDAAVRSGQKPLDAGWSDWVPSVLTECRAAVYKELCAPDRSGLNKQYSDLLNKGLTTDGVAAVSTMIAQVINPTFAISSVLIYLSIWLLKVGLNRWCTYPPEEASAGKTV